MPPDAGENTADHVRQHIKGVSGHAQQVRSDDFKQHAPDGEMERNLSEGWRLVMVAETQPALQPEQERQRAGNEQQIIEVTPDKGRMHVWLDRPPIQRVKRATRQAQRVAPVTKWFHSNARMISPAPSARRNLQVKIIPNTSPDREAWEGTLSISLLPPNGSSPAGYRRQSYSSASRSQAAPFHQRIALILRHSKTH